MVDLADSFFETTAGSKLHGCVDLSIGERVHVTGKSLGFLKMLVFVWLHSHK